jgi:membrane protein implicated in regulation of membrane protease activity
MAQIILFILLVGGGWMLYKRFIKDAEKLTARSNREEKQRQTGAIGTLEKDPETGEYRLKKDEDS